MGAAKLALRDQLLTGTEAPSAGGRSASGHAPSRTTSLAAPEVRSAATVAAYVSVSSEPGTGPLLDALAPRASG